MRGYNLSVYFPQEHINAITEECKKSGQSISMVIRKAVEAYLNLKVKGGKRGSETTQADK